MRDYELTFIIRILPSDEEVNQAIDQVISFIELGDNGVVKSVDRKIVRSPPPGLPNQWPARRPLRLDSSAAIQPDHLVELETELKLFDSVLRYLLVREEGEVKQPAA